MPLVNDGNQAINGFAPDPTLSQTFTIGTDTSIDVSGWIACRWKSQDGSDVTRKLNANSVGLTAAEGVDVLAAAVTSITFTGTSGAVVEVEGMK